MKEKKEQWFGPLKVSLKKGMGEYGEQAHHSYKKRQSQGANAGRHRSYGV